MAADTHDSKPWTDAEIETLREAAAAGETPAVIAKRLPGRSRMSVGGKLTRLGLRRAGPRPQTESRGEERRPIPRVTGSTLPELPSQRREA